MYYKLVGKKAIPTSLTEWALIFTRNTISRWSNGEVTVSTVFLGLDHGYPPNPKCPVLFETVVFGGNLDGSMSRYRTYDLALKGHSELVKLVIGRYCVWSIIKGGDR